ncbi:Receptor-type guanylate cyclase gcy [Seminavis robusta]|uniref:Receptor-type guanylate cyclase gcy n=1 Tax=Seminavis robusta TaxID=568900 RepID=A0A9N8HNH2_9STRA|nr:Receptor-type guanylate cyclase gcy [Seminavis robusta]|eukprot:Sro1084_g239470.1 Receptor-type guanylate cyclase gcy (1189) ;mRNA; r:9389-13959
MTATMMNHNNFALDTIQDDEESSVGSNQDVTSSHGTDREASSSRDEEAEIRKQSAKETKRVSMWRAFVAMALLATAVAVTATTYSLLVKDEDEAFRTVYAQFARSLADSAILQQKDLRDGYRGLADQMALNAEIAGDDGVAKWPFFWPPKFEHTAKDFFRVSNCEWVAVNNVVEEKDRDAFVNFTTAHYRDAYKESHMIRHGNLDRLDDNVTKYLGVVTKFERVNGTGAFVEDDKPRERMLIRTMQSPPPGDYSRSPNWNQNSSTFTQRYLGIMQDFPNETLFMGASRVSFLTVSEDEHQGYHSDDGAEHPHTYSVYPIHRGVGDTNSELVGWSISALAWDAPLRNLLPDNVRGLLAVVSNTCNTTFSYFIEGKDAWFIGYEDAHEPKYNDMSLFVDLALDATPALYDRPGHCMYSMKIYPTQEFEDNYKTSTPIIFATVVASTFLLVFIVFLMYDRMVLKRNEKMISNAAKSNAIVTSIVPDHLRDRLLNRQDDDKDMNGKKNGTLKTFLNNEHGGQGMERGQSPPLADLFLDTTVCFADIVGFTAWSSARDPSQVFTLLETLYQRFDYIAKKRRVFKVETVGDCYVAVCGLPEPRRDHSAAMCRFGRDILAAMNVLTNELVVTLGPDTGDLMLRIGLHSGPVTAGVLRGERARFQLFGDTMNTAARMESASKPNRIQCSKETAEHLIKLGKNAWIQKRSEPIVLKGKGEREGYWVTVRGDRAGSVASGVSAGSEVNPPSVDGSNSTGNINRYSSSMFVAETKDRTGRLIDWNCEVLTKLLKEVRARQMMTAGSVTKADKVNESTLKSEIGGTPLEEVREIVTMPHFDASGENKEIDAEDVQLPETVKDQLRSYIAIIAGLYRDNPFHNFEHASHVMMSVNKLMSRIVPRSDFDGKTAHDHTFGISADPLTRFACAFSALIHDVDHSGVSNAQLVKDQVPLAKKYKDRSVAEQNSLDLAWELLMGADYKDLRACMFQTQSDLVRFRRLVVNAVMSTDIVDKDLKALRNNRWEKAFKKDETGSTSSLSSSNSDSEKDRIDRKATIVIEHIIQASDISHTMQHWIVYRKWNQKLFDELYVAYLNGKMDKDPATFWYQGEIGFFDFYIIPLTRKLKECGVFGVSSEEYLQYAISNRKEWEARGEACVAILAEEAMKKYGVKGMPQLQHESHDSLEEQAPPVDIIRNVVAC